MERLLFKPLNKLGFLLLTPVGGNGYFRNKYVSRGERSDKFESAGEPNHRGVPHRSVAAEDEWGRLEIPPVVW
jgi:hypothetical protein